MCIISVQESCPWDLSYVQLANGLILSGWARLCSSGFQPPLIESNLHKFILNQINVQNVVGVSLKHRNEIIKKSSSFGGHMSTLFIIKVEILFLWK